MIRECPDYALVAGPPLPTAKNLKPPLLTLRTGRRIRRGLSLASLVIQSRSMCESGESGESGVGGVEDAEPAGGGLCARASPLRLVTQVLARSFDGTHDCAAVAWLVLPP